MDKRQTKGPECAMEEKNGGKTGFLRVVIAFCRTPDSLAGVQINEAQGDSGEPKIRWRRPLFANEVFLAQIETGPLDINDQTAQKRIFELIATSVRKTMATMKRERLSMGLNDHLNKEGKDGFVWGEKEIERTSLTLWPKGLLCPEPFAFMALPAMGWAAGAGFRRFSEQFEKSLSNALISPVKQFSARSLIDFRGSEPLPRAGDAIDTVIDAFGETNMDPLGKAFQDPAFVAHRESVYLRLEVMPESAMPRASRVGNRSRL